MDINLAINQAQQMANHFKVFKEVEIFLQEAAAIHADIATRTASRDQLKVEVDRLVADKKQAEADREAAIQAHHDKLAGLASSYADAEQAHMRRVKDLHDMYENAKTANEARISAMETSLEEYAKDTKARKQAITNQIEAAQAALDAKKNALAEIDQRVKAFLGTVKT